MAETKDPEDDTADIVYVASQRLRSSETEATLEMRQTDDGQLAVMVYSSLDTLVAGAGPNQPWIAVPRERVGELVRRGGADGVLLDTVIPPGLRHGNAEGPQ